MTTQPANRSADLGAAAAVTALVFVFTLGVSTIKSGPAALSGDQAAIEMVLLSFALFAIAVSALGAAARSPQTIVIGGAVWALLFYLCSLVLDVVSPHVAGTAIRVGAGSGLAFALATAWLSRTVESAPGGDPIGRGATDST